MLNDAMAINGLIAILRGVTPHEVLEVGQQLYAAGFRIIEVPLNSPDPLRSIRTLRDGLPADCLIGAGTVLSERAVLEVQDAGGELIVMPHSDPKVLRAAKAAGLQLAPGVVTPTEAFAALDEGADALKLFPAEALTPAVVRALLAVLPKGTPLVPVGGITPTNMGPFLEAGVAGFGLGSGLFKPGLTAAQVRERADAYALGWQQAR
ncbi:MULTISPECIES: 2-dehydro-3-deoxy-6-phosphogalactonate aldolase [Pseudomonas]|uniref:2-dehydro-3-deoxy-6-phosphogalactonate aldolase n=1 Tax=Pseudomonas quercus TaxID=2722792 RepID=A0ABX0YAS1_9PSED|nr:MULTISPECIES: 2-dehydro-3-deoxy-6-phosphogalactonate aldolase [Pseudomonas]MBF7140857.1 2-dehydro-3-deoxy-6-phosphogalactonate aldolase [Pseudomonas sp. LY10J]NJO99391.1 2-dehydro-3-deoxy-6-phosphogalactonate aldolase [Pseudomonas quercus]